MNSYSLNALFYFPTTVLLIDDNSIFLSALSLKIDKYIPLVLIDNPKKALQLLQDAPVINTLSQKIMTKLCAPNDEMEVSASICTSQLNFYEEIYNAKRFNHISTIVIDYSMPHLNGADLCREIKQLPIKKIMLTAEADHQKAVELFNEGIIDYFIVKDSVTMHQNLNEMIKKAQLDYFKQASSALLAYLCEQQLHFIPNEIQAIHSTFLTSYTDKNFSEYYLLDASGSMVWLDFNGKPSWLIVKSAAEIDAYYDIALNQDAPQEIIKGLETKSVIPFFFNEIDYQLSAQEWEPYLHKVAFSSESKNYFCSIIEDHALEPLRIQSHGSFLKHL